MRLTRRQFGLATGAGCATAMLPGCRGEAPAGGELEAVWGRQGIFRGQFQKPRAIAISASDELYIVDKLARIQVFDRHGEWQREWKTPKSHNGKPSGLSFDNDGNLMVADTHYFRVLFYTPDGKLIEEKTIGGTNGYGPGEFNFVTDCVQDSSGCFYIGEYGEHDRIQKFSPEGEFLFQWGTFGSGDEQFVRPQNMVIDKQDHIWIVDACNHRVKVYDATGEDARLVKLFGEQGKGPGQFHYPYDLTLDDDGHLYIVEFQNNRVQKLTTEGEPVASWGRAGRREGELMHPWAIGKDSRGRLHVVDSENHRVQRIWL